MASFLPGSFDGLAKVHGPVWLLRLRGLPSVVLRRDPVAVLLVDVCVVFGVGLEVEGPEGGVVGGARGGQVFVVEVLLQQVREFHALLASTPLKHGTRG